MFIIYLIVPEHQVALYFMQQEMGAQLCLTIPKSQMFARPHLTLNSILFWRLGNFDQKQGFAE